VHATVSTNASLASSSLHTPLLPALPAYWRFLRIKETQTNKNLMSLPYVPSTPQKGNGTAV